jgi:hypothetical protein
MNEWIDKPTPWGLAHLQKPPVMQQLKKFLTFYGTKNVQLSVLHSHHCENLNSEKFLL